jgi:protein-disulfide isomerase
VRVGSTLDELLKQYPKEVRLVYKMHPLPMHANAMVAAKGALAAQAQGKFLEMHHKLDESSSALSRDKVIEIAKGLGLDMDRFAKDMDSDAVKARIDRETKETTDIGASGTPAMFVNGRYVSGAKPLEFFKGMADEELKWAKEKNRPPFTAGKNVRDAMPPQAAAQAGPDPNKAYEIPVGKAPLVGAKNARVTILHYMDYQ